MNDTQGMTPELNIMRFFTYEHLTESRLRECSKMFCELANRISAELPSGPEKAVCLRALLEAKDAGVRSLL